jgi:hypothetical protein
MPQSSGRHPYRLMFAGSGAFILCTVVAIVGYSGRSPQRNELLDKSEPAIWGVGVDRQARANALKKEADFEIAVKKQELASVSSEELHAKLLEQQKAQEAREQIEKSDAAVHHVSVGSKSEELSEQTAKERVLEREEKDAQTLKSMRQAEEQQEEKRLDLLHQEDQKEMSIEAQRIHNAVHKFATGTREESKEEVEAKLRAQRRQAAEEKAVEALKQKALLHEKAFKQAFRLQEESIIASQKNISTATIFTDSDSKDDQALLLEQEAKRQAALHDEEQQIRAASATSHAMMKEEIEKQRKRVEAYTRMLKVSCIMSLFYLFVCVREISGSLYPHVQEKLHHVIDLYVARTT